VVPGSVIGRRHSPPTATKPKGKSSALRKGSKPSARSPAARPAMQSWGSSRKARNRYRYSIPRNHIIRVMPRFIPRRGLRPAENRQFEKALPGILSRAGGTHRRQPPVKRRSPDNAPARLIVDVGMGRGWRDRPSCYQAAAPRKDECSFLISSGIDCSLKAGPSAIPEMELPHVLFDVAKA
jgi:hypothetical protein